MEFLLNPTTFKLAGLGGVLIGILAVIIPGLVYQGTKGEKFSFLNHYISELGEVGVSKLAWVFNAGMILAGLCIVIGFSSLGLLLPGFWAKVGLLFGVITGLALLMVGVFSMNKMKGHMVSAVTFFRAGLLMVSFFSVAIILQQNEAALLPRWVGLVGAIPVLAFGIFLGLMWSVRKEDRETLSTEDLERPRIWRFAISEWSIFFSLIFWILIVALAI